MREENTLKAFFHLGERDGDFTVPRSMAILANKRRMGEKQLRKSLVTLRSKGFVQEAEGHWMLTETGMQNAARIIKLHRLWELYLTNYMNIAPDHVHDDAETIEHIITPEIENELELLLGYPGKDPHRQKIPRL